MLQVPMEWKAPVQIEDNSNNDYCLSYQPTVCLVPSALHALILPEKDFFILYFTDEETEAKGLNNLCELA